LPVDTGRVPGRISAFLRGKASDPGGSSTCAQDLISPDWIVMVPVMALAMTLMALGTLELPPRAAVIPVLCAIVVAAGARGFAGIEQRVGASLALRVIVMVVAIGVPMGLFGHAVAMWVAEVGPSARVIGVGVLAIVGTLAGAVLTGRLPSVVTAAMALWLVPVAGTGTMQSWLMLAAGAVGGGLAIMRQSRLDRLARVRDEERARRQLRAEEILHDYEQTGQGWFWETDRRGLLTYVSVPLGAVLGRDPATLPGTPLVDLFLLQADSESARMLHFHLSARSAFHDLALRAASPGDERWWSVSGRPIHDAYDNFLGFRGSGADLTGHRRSQAQAARLAHYDTLTGLANRFQLARTLDEILSATRPEERACAVLLLDLDRFKQVNDSLGHPAGDALLKQVAQRLEAAVGSIGCVGRLGGDEFEVVLPGRIARARLAALAGQIIAQVSQPYRIDGHHVTIGVSIGIAIAPDDAVNREQLIRSADLALYAAKDAGRGCHHFYAAELHSDAEARRLLEQDLREAIARGELELQYQPVVHVATERITGFEALLRWNHPLLGQLTPARFIPVAEDAGLIAQIGEWVLRTACNDLSRWPGSVRVAVNLSPHQFANPALPAIVASALATSQIHPARLELEITESVFVNDSEGTQATFSALKRLGVRIVLDDFGTGYSSLAFLSTTAFDKIKIDGSLVHGAVMQGSRNAAVIAAIVGLAGTLGMETAAEGVETLDELDVVRALGCSHVQGYVYEPPQAASTIVARLSAGLAATAQGPRSKRQTRRTMLLNVVLEHGGDRYVGTVRDLSDGGALIEGLWNVPPGTPFEVCFSDGRQVRAVSRWSQGERMGIAFVPSSDTAPVDVSAPIDARVADPARDSGAADFVARTAGQAFRRAG